MNDQPPTIKLNTPVLPALVVISLILMLIDGYDGWVILFITFGGVGVISAYWAWALSRGLRIEREIRFGWAQVGDQLEERFALINHARVPALWVEVVGQTNMPDYWANQVRSVKQNSETRWLIRGACTRRGLYTLGPTTITTSDPFNVFTVTLHDPASTTLIVTPPVVPLPAIQVAPGGKSGEGAPRVDAPDRTVSSSGVREYQFGDSVRWIHWRTSARQNDLFVRVFDGTPAGDWWILLDLDRSVQIGKGEDATQEHGIILAASLADVGMRTGRAVGLAAYGQELVWHRPQMSDIHKWSILRSLALVDLGDVPLSELLELSRPSLSKTASLIVITSSIRENWLASLLSVRRQGMIPTVLLLDPLTFGGTTGSAKLVNRLAAHGIAHEVISRQLLERGQSNVENRTEWTWRDPAKSAFRSLGPQPGVGVSHDRGSGYD